MSEQFKFLFSPIQIGPVTVRNRIAMTPHGGGLTVNRGLTANDRLAYYLADRAKGGAGLIEVEGALAVPERHVGGWAIDYLIEAFDERCIPGYRKLAQMIHDHGGKAFAELENLGVWVGMGPSAVTDLWTHSTAYAVTEEEIAGWVDYYGISARHVKAAGLDGILLHGAHGLGINQFNSPLFNKRTDRYGGALEKRLTFLIEIIDRIRREIGNDMALGVRLNVDERLPGGNTLADGVKMAQILAATGKVDYLSVDTAVEPHMDHLIIAAMYAQQGYQVSAAAAVREAVSIPVMAVGRIVDPLHAERILADGHADLVGMTRAQIADPELANKAKAGRVDDIRPCMGCNENCYARSFLRTSLGCSGNPAAGKEQELGIGTLKPSPVRKKVMVIGGGLAGMEAARVAAERGHRVSLHEKSEAFGGQMNISSMLPGRSEIGSLTRWFAGQLPKLGVEVHLGDEMTAEKVLQARPDAVVVATGASYTRDCPSPVTVSPVSGWDQEIVTTPEEVISGRRTCGDRVIIVDETAHIVGLGLAEWLASRGKSVELITSSFAHGVSLLYTLQLPWVYPRVMSMDNIVLTTDTLVTGISGKTVKTVNPHSGKPRDITGVDTVVMITGKMPNRALWEALRGKVGELHLAGDAHHAGSGLHTMGEVVAMGHQVGRQI